MAVNRGQKRKVIRPIISIVGAGGFASTLAVALKHAGYGIDSIISREDRTSLIRAKGLAKIVGSRPTAINKTQISADVVWLCVPDAAISGVAAVLARIGGSKAKHSKAKHWKGTVALHSSGALSSDELAPLRQQGVAVASVHPLMTFVKGGQTALTGVPFAIEGDAAAVRTARRIVNDLGGQAFSIDKRQKAAYHAWATLASPLLTALLATTERVAAAAGVSAKDARRRMLPIVTKTVANYGALGAASGFSGPIVRGDVEVVRQHLRALRAVPEARELYVALTRAAVKCLPGKRKDMMRRLLNQKLLNRKDART